MEGAEGVDRRTALKMLIGGVTAISLAACGYYDNQSTKVEINEEDYYLLKEKNYQKSSQDYDGKFYDITTNQFTADPHQGILLPKEDFFLNERSLFHWRETKATPEMLQNNPVFQQIIRHTEELMEATSKSLGGQYKDFILPQAVATAVRKTLKYDHTKAQWGSLSTYDFRLKMG
ncbi:MAG TPA: hypothetical protein PLS49_05010, partial [Candidatus Woesebacteria bacterium]|nr:hypothetical protein [Candidatus Woesebacteria bacterium]